MKTARIVSGTILILAVFVFPVKTFASVIWSQQNINAISNNSSNPYPQTFIGYVAGVATQCTNMPNQNVGSVSYYITTTASTTIQLEMQTNGGGGTQFFSDPLTLQSGGQIATFIFSGTNSPNLLNDCTVTGTNFPWAIKMLQIGGPAFKISGVDNSFGDVVFSGATTTCNDASHCGSVQTPYIQVNSGNFIQGITVGTATSSVSLFSGQSATDTLNALNGQCSQIGNIFGEALCVAGSFLFLPNQATINEFVNLPSTAETKFPFSWVSSLQSTVGGLSASSTSNIPTYAFNLHDLNIGATSTIGNILPNFVGFSSTTVLTYMSQTMLDTLKYLVAAGLWLGLVFDVYTTVRRRHATV